MRRFLMGLAVLVLVSVGSLADAEKGKNLRLIVVLEKTTEDPNLKIVTFTDESSDLMSGKKVNPRLAVAVGVADSVDYGTIKTFSNFDNILIVGRNLDGDGLVLHCHETAGNTTVEETFTLTANTNEGEVPPSQVNKLQRGAIAQILMEENPTVQDEQDAVDLLQRAALTPDALVGVPGGVAGEIDLSWSSVKPTSEPERYNVYRGSAPDVTIANGTKIASDIGVTTFTDTGIPSTNTRFYVVTSILEISSVDIESLESNEVEVVAP